LTLASTVDPAAVLIVICPDEALISVTLPKTCVVLMAGSGVCAKAALAKQTSIKLEINIDIVRTVLSLVSLKVNHYLRPAKRIGCKKFGLLQQITALRMDRRSE
jgi:hypothetical protein